jgi:hypothetical protein
MTTVVIEEAVNPQPKHEHYRLASPLPSLQLVLLRRLGATTSVRFSLSLSFKWEKKRVMIEMKWPLQMSEKCEFSCKIATSHY